MIHVFRSLPGMWLMLYRAHKIYDWLVSHYHTPMRINYFFSAQMQFHTLSFRMKLKYCGDVRLQFVAISSARYWTIGIFRNKSRHGIQPFAIGSWWVLKYLNTGIGHSHTPSVPRSLAPSTPPSPPLPPSLTPSLTHSLTHSYIFISEHIYAVLTKAKQYW